MWNENTPETIYITFESIFDIQNFVTKPMRFRHAGIHEFFWQWVKEVYS